VHGINGTDPEALSRAEVETQRQMFEVFRFLRRRVPGFAAARLLGSSYQVGVRETRHIVGDYVLTLDDVLSGRDFPDTIAPEPTRSTCMTCERVRRNWGTASAGAASHCVASSGLRDPATVPAPHWRGRSGRGRSLDFGHSGCRIYANNA
jgi:hypothetical protein